LQIKKLAAVTYSCGYRGQGIYLHNIYSKYTVEKPEGKPRMDNPEKQATFDTRYNTQKTNKKHRLLISATTGVEGNNR
jgi:hypothetical protein